MAKILFIIPPKNFRDEELLEPQEILSHNNIIDIASNITGTCTGMLGTKVNANLTLRDARAKISEYAAVIFVGGSGSNIYHNDVMAHAIARAVVTNQNQVLAAICWAVVTLAKAEVLTGRKITGWISPTGEEKKIFAEAKAIYQPKDVAADGRIITASGPHAAYEFGEKIKQLLMHKV